jgi:hypothetical protein
MDRQIGLELLGGMVGLGLVLSCAILASLRGLKSQLDKQLEVLIASDNAHRQTALSNQEYVVSLIAELKPPQPRKKNGEFAHKPKGWTELSKGLEAGTIPVKD